ncbi:MAG: hypothetical protein NZM00_11995, partial [Anaerolinea sp.]|nr:hypothetical protein [Anaerolinea sp.]
MTDNPSESPEKHGAAGRSLRRVIILVTGALIGAVLLLFVVAVVIALTSDLEQSSAVIRLIRDLVIIFLALEGILIVLSLA